MEFINQFGDVECHRAMEMAILGQLAVLALLNGQPCPERSWKGNGVHVAGVAVQFDGKKLFRAIGKDK